MIVIKKKKALLLKQNRDSQGMIRISRNTAVGNDLKQLFSFTHIIHLNYLTKLPFAESTALLLRDKTRWSAEYI
jgi:hypothetical protein